MAARLNLSARSFRRNLALEGSCFRDLRDEERMEQAARMLRFMRMSAEEIAGMVGYSEGANFRRAYRRWTGASPGSARQDGMPARAPIAARTKL